MAVDPDGAARRARRAAGSRRIDRLGQPDSMASWAMSMPAQVEGDLWAEVTRRARASRAALRAAGREVGTGLDALRVDSVIDALLGPGAAARLIRQLDTEDTEDTGDTEATDATDEVDAYDGSGTDRDPDHEPDTGTDTDDTGEAAEVEAALDTYAPAEVADAHDTSDFRDVDESGEESGR